MAYVYGRVGQPYGSLSASLSYPPMLDLPMQGVKGYVALNVLIFDEELEALEQRIRCGLDGEPESYAANSEALCDKREKN
eukprot:1154973-Pelagomonas_calceolata.AAC.5